MATIPTISDVAARAGVSKGAVSFALNGRPGVSEETRERILRAARELGFTPSHIARALSTKRSDTFGLVLTRSPEMLRSDPFFPPFIAGVESVIAPSGQSLMLRFVDPEQEGEVYTHLANAHRVDGVFLSDLRMDDPRPALLEKLHLPYVSLNRPTVESAEVAVCLDDRRGIRDAVEHLLALGHRRIGHVAGPAQYLHSSDRRSEWAGVLSAAGIADGPLVEADFTAIGGAAATRALLDQRNPPTAILYASDLMAIAGMSVAHQRGLSIPEDLSIVGFDDAELSALLHPPLATVHTDAYGWGRAAASALVARLAGEAHPDIHLAPARFIARGSIGAAPGAGARAKELKPTQHPPKRRGKSTKESP